MATSTEPVLTVPVPELKKVMQQALRGAGASGQEAELQVHLLLEAELRGHPSHGIRRLPILLERIRNGRATLGRDPVIEWTTECVAQIDGLDGLGAVVADTAVRAARERATVTGVALACVRRGNHIGMLAPYVEQLASDDMIGIALTTSEALVHPWGGLRPLVGTNPIGVAIPTGDSASFVLDMSTAAVSMGRILDHGERDLPLTEGWAIDANGHAATDAGSVHAISPFGGPKGFALGVAFELLVAVLTRTALGTQVQGTLDTTEVATKGDVFIAISLERLGLKHMLPTVSDYLVELRQSSASPDAPVLIPGERARASRQQRLRDGVPVTADVWYQVLHDLQTTREHS